MSDIDLPVFSFRCNWLEPFTERLSFLTSILASEEGAEQRRSLRLTPRRSFDIDILLRGNERTFWDLFVDRLGAGEVMVPLYWEVVSTPVATVAGITNRINFDTLSREWDGVGLALLLGKTALDSEVIQILDVDPTGIDLVTATGRSWPAGTKLLPLRRGVISEAGEPIALTGAVSSVTTRLTLTAPNPWVPAVDLSPVYAGLPVFLDEPNWVDPLATSYNRDLVETDNETGKIYRVDPVGRVTLGQEHRWFLKGRELLASFRDLVYRHRGRSGAFWLPTFKHDLRLANSPGALATDIQVEKVGFDYIGGPASGREYIAIKHDAGTILRKILTVTPGPGASRETLGLDAPLGLALSPGLVRRISFADTARFDQDDFEITHYGGVDALHEVTGRFRTFKNSRTAPAPIHYPVAISAMSDARCGGPDVDLCYVAPLPPAFDGWYFMMRAVLYSPVPGQFLSFNTNHGTHNLFSTPGGYSITTGEPCRPFGSGLYSKCLSGSQAENTLYTEWRYDVDVNLSGITLRSQRQHGNVSPQTRQLFQYRRWFDTGWTTIMGVTGDGVDAQTALDGSVDYGNTFPFDNYWTFP